MKILMNADMLCRKMFNPVVAELFIGGIKLIIPLVFITDTYFIVPKISRLYSLHYFIVKTLNAGELQQITINCSFDIDFKTL